MDYHNRLISLLTENSRIKRKFRNAEIRAEHKRRGQPDKQRGHSSTTPPPEDAEPAGRTPMNADDYEPGTTEKNQAENMKGQRRSARRRVRHAQKHPKQAAQALRRVAVDSDIADSIKRAREVAKKTTGPQPSTAQKLLSVFTRPKK